MQDPNPDAAPLNPVPAPILALAAIIVGIELILWAASRGIVGGPAGIGWRIAAVEDYGFYPRLWAYMAQTGDWSMEGVQRVLTYAFVSTGFVHALFALVFVLAFGKFVGDVMGGVRALVIFVVSAVGAAVLYGTVFPNQGPLVGAYPGAYGLLGGYTYVLFLMLDHADENRLQAFRLVGVLAGLQLLFGVLFPGPPHWLADLGGAAIGFAVAAAMGPGGLLRLIRRR